MIDDEKFTTEREPSSEIEETPSPDDADERIQTEASAPTAGEASGSDAEDETETLESAEQDAPAVPAVPEEVLLSRMESIVFASPEPMSVRKLANILGVEGKIVRELADTLMAFYADRGVILEEISKGFQFRTNPKNAAVIRDVFKLKPLKISRAALETLAIVAYRQPLTRAETEQIRGVDCGGVMKYLFEKNLVRVIGRKEEPGRPIIYGTTNAFLELFGLKTLSDLPALHEFSELWEENQRIVDEEMPNLENSDAQSRPAAPSAPSKDDRTGDGSETPSSILEDENQSGVENSDEISDESGEQTDKEGAYHMSDKKRETTREQPADPNQVPTEIINESEMENILASINPPRPEPQIITTVSRDEPDDDDTTEITTVVDDDDEGPTEVTAVIDDDEGPTEVTAVIDDDEATTEVTDVIEEDEATTEVTTVSLQAPDDADIDDEDRNISEADDAELEEETDEQA